MPATGYVSSTGDARKVNKSGDTMTGDLVLNDGSPDTVNSAAAKAYVDALAATKAALAHSAQHAAGGGDPVTLTQAQITGLVAALAALAPLAGATFTGPVTVDDSNFVVLGTNKGYRFRPNGARLDCEATGSDWILSVFAGTNFDGTQRTYLRLESGVTLAHACGTWIFTDTPDSGAVHTIDGSGDKLGFHGATAVAKQTVTGAKGGNAALGDLITKLATLGLITDGTS